MSYTELLKNIKTLTNNPNTTLEEFIKLDYITFFYNQGLPCLIQFFVAKSEELLKLSIDSPDNALRTKAHEIICGDNTDIIQSMICNKTISKVTEKYMFDDNTSQIILSRLITLFERCFTVDFAQSSNQLYFITEFVRFLKDPNVIGFFSDCAEHPIFGNKFIQWLNELEFDEKLMDTVQNELNKQKNDPDYLYGLFTLIDKCLHNDEVRSRFLTPSKLSLIIQPCHQEASEYVKIAHAQMILDLCNEFSIQFVSDLINDLAKYIFNQDNVDFSNETDENKKMIEKNLNGIKKINELFLLDYQILIKIFTIVNIENNYFPLSILIDLAFTILNNFQSHSFALIVASNFIIQCSQIDSPIRSYIIGRFIPFAKVNLESNENLNIIAFIYKIMDEFENNVNWSNLNKEQFSNLYEKFIIPKKQIIDAQYGGEAPPPQELCI